MDESHFPIISFLLLPLPSASRFFFPFLVFFVVAPPSWGFCFLIPALCAVKTGPQHTTIAFCIPSFDGMCGRDWESLL